MPNFGCQEQATVIFNRAAEQSAYANIAFEPKFLTEKFSELAAN